MRAKGRYPQALDDDGDVQLSCRQPAMHRHDAPTPVTKSCVEHRVLFSRARLDQREARRLRLARDAGVAAGADKTPASDENRVCPVGRARRPLGTSCRRPPEPDWLLRRSCICGTAPAPPALRPCKSRSRRGTATRTRRIAQAPRRSVLS